MRKMNSNFFALLLGLAIFTACSEEANLAKEPQPQRLAKAYLQGQMPYLEGAGMMNIMPLNDSLRFAFEGDLELKKREVDLAQQILSTAGDWPAINAVYRDYLANSKTSPHAWYEQQVVANQALYTLFVHFPEEVRTSEDVSFYTQILIDWQSANAWRMAQSLIYLQEYWSEEQIRDAALVVLTSAALPVEEDLQEKLKDENLMPFLRDMIKRHLKGTEILNELSLVTN